MRAYNTQLEARLLAAAELASAELAEGRAAEAWEAYCTLPPGKGRTYAGEAYVAAKDAADAHRTMATAYRFAGVLSVR